MTAPKKQRERQYTSLNYGFFLRVTTLTMHLSVLSVTFRVLGIKNKRCIQSLYLTVQRSLTEKKKQRPTGGGRPLLNQNDVFKFNNW